MGWVVSVTTRPPLPRKSLGTHWVGARAGLDRCWKSRPPPGFDPRTFQHIASRYTDWATAAHAFTTGSDNMTRNFRCGCHKCGLKSVCGVLQQVSCKIPSSKFSPLKGHVRYWWCRSNKEFKRLKVTAVGVIRPGRSARCTPVYAS